MNMTANGIFRKACAVLTVLSVMGMTATAQNKRTISVWQDNQESVLDVYAIDSMVIQDDGKLNVYGLYTDESFSTDQVDSMTVRFPEIVSTNKISIDSLKAIFNALDVKNKAFKAPPYKNPLMGHKFGADPFGMVDGDRLYVYMTDDHLYRSTDGKPITGSFDYTDCKSVTIISSDDLVNWTDHGTQPVAGGPASWASQMWAPCAAHKTIDGKENYFLYFSNNSSGIGVLTSDTPYGPWTDPIGKAMIDHSTANCSGKLVPSVYDPAVLIDDDGKAYLYFGGGIDNLDAADPGSARCVQLGDDMTSIVGTPVEIRPPCLFEDAGINKVGGKYLYSYCANFNADGGPGRGNVGYMKSDNPLGPFTYVGCCSENPGGASWAGGGGNHHHAIVEFKGKYYLLYHNRALKSAMRSSTPDINDNVELRSTCISEIKVNTTNATITNLKASDLSQTGVAQLKNFDPYQTVQGATMAWENGVTTKYNKANRYCSAEMTSGSWMCLSNVDFRNGPVGFIAEVKGKGAIKICLRVPGKSAKTVVLAQVPNNNSYQTITVPVVESVTGVQEKVYIVAEGSISIKSWSFF